MSNIVQFKNCNKCQQNKPVSEFHKCKRDGYQAQCKTCQKERIRESREAGSKVDYEYYKRNREDIIRRFNERMVEQRESYRAKRREYYQRHHDRIISYFRKYLPNQCDEAKQRRKAVTRKWRVTHPENEASTRNRRRARLLEAEGNFTEQEWKSLCEKYDNRCLSCGKRCKVTVDHIKPISIGGSNSIDNIQPLCRRCNSAKGTKEIDYR